MAKKALEQELKRPDEFVSFWTHLGAKLSAHRKMLIASTVVVVVAAGAAWGVVTLRNSRAAKATSAFARIDRMATAPLLPEKADKADIEAAAKEDASVDVPRFKTEKERVEAAIAEADAFLATYGAEGLGRQARFGKAGRLVVIGKPDEAAKIYETLAAGEPDPGLRAIQQEGAAAAYEAAGKLDEALRAYAALADSSQRSGTFYLDRALFAKARILEKQGKGKDAEQALRDILAKVPKTLLRQQIDDRLAVLTEK